MPDMKNLNSIVDDGVVDPPARRISIKRPVDRQIKVARFRGDWVGFRHSAKRKNRVADAYQPFIRGAWVAFAQLGP